MDEISLLTLENEITELEKVYLRNKSIKSGFKSQNCNVFILKNILSYRWLWL